MCENGELYVALVDNTSLVVLVWSGGVLLKLVWCFFFDEISLFYAPTSPHPVDTVEFIFGEIYKKALLKFFLDILEILHIAFIGAGEPLETWQKELKSLEYEGQLPQKFDKISKSLIDQVKKGYEDVQREEWNQIETSKEYRKTYKKRKKRKIKKIRKYISM